jgi:hypothetical protein
VEKISRLLGYQNYTIRNTALLGLNQILSTYKILDAPIIKTDVQFIRLLELTKKLVEEATNFHVFTSLLVFFRVSLYVGVCRYASAYLSYA